MLSVQAICDDIIITTTTTQYSTAKGQRKTIARPSKILLEIKKMKEMCKMFSIPDRAVTQPSWQASLFSI